MKLRKRRSFFNVGGIIDNFSSTGDQDKSDHSFRLAVYNGLALLLVVICIFTAYSVFYILQPFIRPLLWALLCGSALHPIKEVLADKLKTHLDYLESPTLPVHINVFCLPFTCVISCSDLVGDFLLKHKETILKLVGTFGVIVICYLYLPNFVVHIIWYVIQLNCLLVDLALRAFSSTLLVCTLVAAFIGGLFILWKPENSTLFSVSAIFIWVAVTAYFANLFTIFQVPTFLLLQSFLIGASIYSKIPGVYLSLLKHIPKPASATQILPQYLVSDDFQSASEVTPTDTPQKENENPLDKEDEKQISHVSGKYMKWLSISCGFVFIASMGQHLPYMLFIFMGALLAVTYLLKALCIKFGVLSILNAKLINHQESIHQWFSTRQNVLLPVSIEAINLSFQKLFECLIRGFREISDSIAAVAVILGLLLFMIFGSIFFAAQAYREGVYLVQTGSSIVNNTIVHNPELHHLLPSDWESTMDSVLNNTYMYVRSALAKWLQEFLRDKGINEQKSLELESNAIDLWDRVYQAWVMPLQPTQATVGPTVTGEAVRHSYQTFIDGLIKTPEVMSFHSIGVMLSGNMALLTSSFDSVWLIIKGNMMLLVNTISTLLSLVFGGGLSVINFAVQMVVFLSALFYLLSASRKIYKPVEVITDISPKYGNKLAVAVEQACKEVLAASAKLSLFYGMWTWLTHTVFQSNLIYMPAVFAATVSVIPVLGTYWACLPAVLDLWLVQESTLLAIGLLVAQFLPTLIVDSTVYNEIQGGHPYLTGLSVAGGILTLGLEGAIMGPLVLCFLFVILNLLSGIALDDPSQTPTPET